jgi:hypothetical protein
MEDEEDEDEGDLSLRDLTEDDEDGQDDSGADTDEEDGLDADQPDLAGGTRFRSQTELVCNFVFSGTGGYGAYMLPERRHTRTSQQCSSTCTYTCVSLYLN